MTKLRVVSAALFWTVASTTSLLATTATSLSSFETEEEPDDIYYPATNRYVSDSYDNMTERGGGVFRMELRYRNSGEWFDSGGHDDRGRAEVKGLGPYQGKGETFDYISTMRTSPNWQNTSRFAHVFQLFTVNGGSSVGYMVQMNFSGSQGAGKLSVNPRSAGTSYTARGFTFTPGTAATYRIQVKGASAGYARLSINGDALTGMDADLTVSSTYTGYRPKWGLYRGFNTGWSLGDTYVEHGNVQANKVTTTGPQTYSFEAEDISYVVSGATSSEDADTAASGDSRVNFKSNSVGDYIEFTLPNVAAGTYQVRLAYKTLDNRGRCTFQFNGAAVGGTLDQYASSPSYPTYTVGTVTLSSSGSPKFRMTVSGKNSASSGYYLSADKITLVGQ
jgi:hypothetical protein